MQAAGDLVGVIVKLTTGVEHRHHHFSGALVLFRVHVDRDASTIINHGDGAVFVNGHDNLGAVTG